MALTNTNTAEGNLLQRGQFVSELINVCPGLDEEPAYVWPFYRVLLTVLAIRPLCLLIHTTYMQ